MVQQKNIGNDSPLDSILVSSCDLWQVILPLVRCILASIINRSLVWGIKDMPSHTLHMLFILVTSCLSCLVTDVIVGMMMYSTQRRNKGMTHSTTTRCHENFLATEDLRLS
jgi:uncharacterized membrane protein YwzB